MGPGNAVSKGEGRGRMVSRASLTFERILCFLYSWRRRNTVFFKDKE